MLRLVTLQRTNFVVEDPRKLSVARDVGYFGDDFHEAQSEQ